ncbi:MAG: transcription termination/antitermination protein NusG [Oscillospiraceae bacterium]|jgi:transcriptional antiterminator NusG|nr:transcription termination/antitermination protein NusG [Oscillospiraceae bacterium]
MLEEKKWYVIQTYSGYENKVASGIETVVKNRSLGDFFGEIKIPSERVVEIRNEKKREVLRKIFPGYLFVKMILNDDTWHAVRSIKGCVGFVGSSARPLPLTQEETEKFGVETPERIEVLYKIGDSVQIVEGPLDGFFGVVKSIDTEKEIVNVLVSMFGRETPVELSLDDVEVVM